MSQRAGEDEEVAELARLLAQMSQRYGIEMPIRAVCEAVHQEMQAVRAQARRHPGDGPEGGDLDDRANYLDGVYQQLYAAYAVAIGG